jgi:hypothetical protein
VTADNPHYDNPAQNAEYGAQHAFTPTTLLSGQTVSMCIRCGLVEGAETDDERCIDHDVEAVPVDKMDGGLIGYRFTCSCGRIGNGWHATPEKAIAAGAAHTGRKFVLSIYCGDEAHVLCDGWFVMWPCSCPCHTEAAQIDRSEADRG